MTLTREDAIERLKQNKAAAEYYAGQSQITAEIENALKDSEAFDMAIEAIRHDVIFEQIKWERDVALQTLEEHGIGLGQKCDAEVVSADAVQGDWLYRWNEVECSVCGEFAKDKSNFCPNCGARMENTK